MKHAGSALFALGFSLLLAAQLSLFTGCGNNQGIGLSARTSKNSAKTFTLSGYTDSVLLTDVNPGQSLGSELEEGTNPRIVKVDPQYQSNRGFLEIKEKMFIAQTNEIYLNPEDYIGKTLKLEGIFHIEQDYTLNGAPYYFVIRYGPGCCAGDGTAGFEVMWENSAEIYPRENDWVEATGVLKVYEEDGYPYTCISLSSLKVLEKRGAEFVTQ